ncbi:hypothetical protein WJX73_004652 [Symbiochloris irregularis]|uniref:NADP-dependent glyceraldehyde-3-phosphate dehydrogenase n=1 Tax=Symbiochloris irregularis TaxID=706552 RepID=A0AAW1NLW0_9CHLO
MGGFYDEIIADGVYKYYINGEWKSLSGKTQKINNPSTNETAFTVTACRKEDVDAAFEAAKKAHKSWAKTPLWKRAELLHKVDAIMKENAQPMADVMVKEIAKPAKDALTEVVRSGDLIGYTAEQGVRSLGEGKLLVSDSFPGQDRSKLCFVSKLSHGPCLLSKIAPALMAGNTVVVKPPTQGAVAGCHMMQCFHKAGFPPGVINFVTGKGSEIGDYLTLHPLCKAISFTGGDTGLAICAKAGMIPIQMELGGKDACIVCEDANIELAAKNIIKGGYSYSGQRCTAVKVVLVHESVADALVEKVKKGVDALTVGRPEDDCAITPVISESSANFIEGLVKDAEQQGATLLQKYKREKNLIWPLLIDNVTAKMRIAWEEPFGPVVPVIRVKTIEEAIDHCNTNNLALQGCVFTENVNRAIQISDAMETGTVQINGAPARGPDHFPFQGMRDSGIGSQGIINSLEMMTKTKTTVLNLDKPSYTMG